MSDLDEFISVHDLDSCKQSTTDNKNNISVYQVQGINNSGKGIIMEVGFLETVHDVLINDFKLLKKFKGYIVSRLYTEEELIKITQNGKNNIFQMIKIIICENGDTMNVPLCYLCFNFVTSINDKFISTDENKIELLGKFTITFHLKDNNYNNKYIQLKQYNEYVGKEDMIKELIESLFNEIVLDELDKK